MHKLKVFIFPAIAAIFLTGYLTSTHNSRQSAKLSDDSIAKMPVCSIQNNRCELHVGQQKLTIQFMSPPEPEEETQVDISASEPINITSAWVEGVNMYMGKTPLLINRVSTNRVSGVFFLGSCHQPLMQWRLMLTLEKQKHPIQVLFETQR
ncbi:hypothetical protein [Alteromonas oceanisediminis]|uniref:hypothetical protein n=1 Tax=Alteromonas oceanisediminis TaxID=2836180 RepID=UPI001BDAF7E2|nr:hypothetical protein [Alteromonas oceanisediminis]MBT0586317.1 hypothetical protein [Alteromonas oceanisediminis]